MVAVLALALVGSGPLEASAEPLSGFTAPVAVPDSTGAYNPTVEVTASGRMLVHAQLSGPPSRGVLWESTAPGSFTPVHLRTAPGGESAALATSDTASGSKIRYIDAAYQTGSLFRMSDASLDDGTHPTWAPVTGWHAAGAQVWMDMNAQGQLFAVYRTLATGQLWFMTSLDDGTTWFATAGSLPGLATTGPIRVSGSRLAVPVIAPVGGQLQLAVSESGGTIWMLLPGPPGASVFSASIPSLAAEGDQLFLTWIDRTTFAVKFASSSDWGQHWTTPMTLSDGGSNMHAWVVARGGRVAVAWQSADGAAVPPTAVPPTARWELAYAERSGSGPFQTGEVTAAGVLRTGPACFSLLCSRFDGSHMRFDLDAAGSPAIVFPVCGAGCSTSSLKVIRRNAGGIEPPEAADEWARALPVGTGTEEPFPVVRGFGLAGTGLQPFEPSPSCAPLATSLWMRIEVPASTPLAADAVATSGDAVVAVYEGNALHRLREIACGTTDVSASFSAEPGSTYYVQLGTQAEAPGDAGVTGTLHVARPSNDDLALAMPIASIADHNVTVDGATLESGEPMPSCVDPDRVAVNSVWYRLTTMTPGEHTLDTVGSSYNTAIAVYRGSTFGTLTEIACSDDILGGAGAPPIEASEAFVDAGLGDVFSIQVVALAPSSLTPADPEDDPSELLFSATNGDVYADSCDNVATGASICLLRIPGKGDGSRREFDFTITADGDNPAIGRDVAEIVIPLVHFPYAIQIRGCRMTSPMPLDPPVDPLNLFPSHGVCHASPSPWPFYNKDDTKVRCQLRSWSGATFSCGLKRISG